MLRRCDCSRVRRCRLANASSACSDRPDGRPIKTSVATKRFSPGGGTRLAVAGACLPAFVFGSEPLTRLARAADGSHRIRQTQVAVECASLRRIVPGTLSMTDPVEFGGSLKSPAGGPDGSSGRDSPPGIADPMPPTDGTGAPRPPSCAAASGGAKRCQQQSRCGRQAAQGICDDDPGSPPICVSTGYRLRTATRMGVF